VARLRHDRALRLARLRRRRRQAGPEAMTEV